MLISCRLLTPASALNCLFSADVIQPYANIMFLDLSRATLLWLMLAPLAFSQYAARLLIMQQI
jgi:hypothetical protein